MGIAAPRVSVVIAGPINRKCNAKGRSITALALDSIRQHMPGAEIVLSTWDHEDTQGLEYDRLVLQPDPGSFSLEHCDGSPFENNVNRMIVAVRGGVAAASRELVMRLRTDCMLTSASAVNLFGKWGSQSRFGSFVSARILICNLFTRDPTMHIPRHGYLPHHPSDIFHFGLRDDVALLWAAPLITADEQKWRICISPATGQPYKWYRLAPEQHIWLHFVRRFQPIVCDHLSHVHSESVADTFRLFAANLCILSPRQLGLRSLKPWFFYKNMPEACVTHGQWLAHYRADTGENVATARRDGWVKAGNRLLHTLRDTGLRAASTKNMDPIER